MKKLPPQHEPSFWWDFEHTPNGTNIIVETDVLDRVLERFPCGENSEEAQIALAEEAIHKYRTGQKVVPK